MYFDQLLSAARTRKLSETLFSAEEWHDCHSKNICITVFILGDKGTIGTQYEAGTGFIRNPKPFYVLLQTRD